MVDARGNTHQFAYDSLGRLTRDDNPAGGFKTLSRRDTTNGYYVTVGTAEGRTSKYVAEKLSTGALVFTNIDMSGLKTVTAQATNGSTTTTAPDGTIIIQTSGIDPRFGMQAPVVKALSVTMPSSLSATISEGRKITQMTGSAVTGFLDSLIINGKVYRTSFDGISKVFTNTTPVGRRVYTRQDSLGHITQDSIPGIAPTNYSYDSDGALL
jgi:YD repeat-containing protein